MATRLYPDTNVALHFYFDRIDWLSLAGEKTVTIVLTNQFVSELDKLKRSIPRARDFSGWLNKWEDGKAQLPTGVNMTFHDISPGTKIDFVKEELDPQEGDDKHIGAMIAARLAHQGDRHILVSADRMITRKAKQRQFECLAPSEGRIEEPSDNRDKELEKLRRENGRLLNAKARLSISFTNGKPVAEWKALFPQPDHDDESFRRFIRSQQMRWQQTAGRKRWAEYREDLESWREMCRTIAYNNALLVPIDLAVRNTGGGPATNVTVDVTVTAPLRLATAGPKEYPRPPTRVSGRSLLDIQYHLESNIDLGTVLNPQIPHLTVYSDTEGRFEQVRDINHEDERTLEQFWIQAPDADTLKNFNFDCVLISATQPEKVESKLSVIITRDHQQLEIPDDDDAFDR